MKYVQPWGISDPDSPYINGDPSIGRQGSIPPAEAFEHPMREIVNVIDKSGLVPASTDLLQMTKGVRSQFLNWAVDTGSVNTLSVAYDPPITEYTLGLLLRVQIHETCTGAATIDAGAGRVQIRKPNGLSTVANDLPAGGIVDLAYDGANFQMVNFGGTPVVLPPDVTEVNNNYYTNQIPYCQDTGTTNSIVAPFSPAITTLAAGDPIFVKVMHTVTGPTTITVNALPAKQVLALGAGALLPGDIVAGDIMLLIYDGMNFLVDPNPIINQNFTIQIPTQYATVDLACAALARKSITVNATVTLNMASGVYAPFVIYHPNADRLVVQGTMIGGMPDNSNFAQSGNTLAQRNNDAYFNLNMLRTRYGTEVRCAAGQAGIQTLSNAAATVQHILITGTNQAIDYSYGIIVDQAPGIVQALVCYNVAVWGVGYAAFYGGGRLRINRCWVSSSQGYGMQATSNGTFWVTDSGVYGCAVDGFQFNFQSLGGIYTSYSSVNGRYGVGAASSSFALVSQCQIYGNANTDIVASIMSLIQVYASGFGSYSPAPWGTPGFYNAMIIIS